VLGCGDRGAPLHVVADDNAVEDIEGGVVDPSCASCCRGLPSLASMAGFARARNLALLVDGEDKRVGRRIDIETDNNVLELLSEREQEYP
jgi:hypothetical protein